MKTLVPAYGRDYKNVKDVKTDWNDKKDFLIADFFDKYDGKPINITDCKSAGIKSVMIRYNRLMKTTVIKIK